MPEKTKIEQPKFISPQLIKEINSILNDYTSGSQEINEKILKLLLKVHSKKAFNYLIEIFKINFTSFQIVQNTLSELEKLLSRKNLKETRLQIRKNLDRYQKRIEKIFNQIKKHIKPSVKILTISNSKTVFDLVKLMHEKKYEPNIFVLISLPGGEGKILHQKLKKHKINSRLIPDKEMRKILNKIDIVITGADKIIDGQFFLNKIKTKRLLTAAREKNKPSFLVTLKEKIVKESDLIVQSKTTASSRNIRFEKNLFEWIDLNLIDEIFIS